MPSRPIGGAPAYDDVQYWEARFSRVAEAASHTDDDHAVAQKCRRSVAQDGIEWLGDGQVLLDALRDRVVEVRDRKEMPYLLHLGAGVSNLGLRMCDHLLESGLSAERFVNIDFSQTALDVGRSRADAWFSNKSREGDDPGHTAPESKEERPRFCQADLRDWASICHAFDQIRHADSAGAPLFDMIIDKSTSDSLATGEPVDVSSSACPLLAEMQQSEHDDGPEGSSHARTMDPLDLVAVHLARWTRKGGVWAALSYTASRFDFLAHPDSLARRLWTIERHSPIPAPDAAAVASAPTIFHHFFLLRRSGDQ